MCGRAGHTTRRYSRLSTSFLGMDDLTYERGFDSQKQRGLLMGLAYSFDMLSIGVPTTKRLPTSGRLGQESNVLYEVFTVCHFNCKKAKNSNKT